MVDLRNSGLQRKRKWGKWLLVYLLVALVLAALGGVLSWQESEGFYKALNARFPDIAEWALVEKTEVQTYGADARVIFYDRASGRFMRDRDEIKIGAPDNRTVLFASMLPRYASSKADVLDIALIVFVEYKHVSVQAYWVRDPHMRTVYSMRWDLQLTCVDAQTHRVIDQRIFEGAARIGDSPKGAFTLRESYAMAYINGFFEK